jgi:hypothetical protein
MNKNSNTGGNNRRQNFNNNTNNNSTNTNEGMNRRNDGFNQRREFNNNNNNRYDARPNNNFDNNNSNSKRGKITFTRDGMNLVCSIKRNTVDDKLPYMTFEIKEKEERNNDLKSEGEPLVNNPRFILINSYQISKILLLNPSAVVGDKLEQISFVQKNRTLNINQQKDNKYVFTLELHMEGQEKTTSQVELNPEDMLFIKLFTQSNFNELNRI